MKINQRQIDAVLALDGAKRYEHFIKVVVDQQRAWALYNEGWALAATDSGERVFPLWPAEEYAQLCANQGWQEYIPESIALEDLLEELLPQLATDSVLPGIFSTPRDKGVTPTIEVLSTDLRSEMQRY
jgi:hypothetical protein